MELVDDGEVFWECSLAGGPRYNQNTLETLHISSSEGKPPDQAGKYCFEEVRLDHLAEPVATVT